MPELVLDDDDDDEEVSSKKPLSSFLPQEEMSLF